MDIHAREFDLELTQESGQTSQPPWRRVEGAFRELLIIEGVPCPVEVRVEDEFLRVNPYSDVPRKPLKKKIEDIFDLKFEIEDLYSFLEDKGLSDVIQSSRGLRLFLAKDPFECIISSIASANCSIKRWTRAVDDIKRGWGDCHVFRGERFYTFPSPATLAGVKEESLEDLQRREDKLPDDFRFTDLRSCGVGYRATYIRETSRIISEELDISEIHRMDYQDAREVLLELPGVGPKVADCILLYGFRKTEAFPVDVWVRRIMKYLYPDRNFSTREIAEFAAREYGEMAGYVQLYLFNHVRRSGLLEKLRG